MALLLPSKGLHRLQLETVALNGDELYRVSSHDSGEPYFGKTGANRFDDNSRTKSKRFAVSYFGCDLLTGMAETLLHNELPSRGVYRVSAEDFRAKHVITVQASNLVLVDMTGLQLKRLAGNGSLSSVMPYDTPQAWSRALHAHPQNFDGILYMSRQINDRKAVAVFDRARHKLLSPKYTKLAQAPCAAQAMLELHISLAY